MKRFAKTLIASALSLSTFAALAMPRHLITHNDTDFESNAFVGSNYNVPSPHPTKAHSKNKVFWGLVQVICGKQSGNCSALIKMKTNTTPVNLGTLNLDMVSGDITPKIVKGNGFTITVMGPGEARITKD